METGTAFPMLLCGFSFQVHLLTSTRPPRMWNVSFCVCPGHRHRRIRHAELFQNLTVIWGGNWHIWEPQTCHTDTGTLEITSKWGCLEVCWGWVGAGDKLYSVSLKNDRSTLVFHPWTISTSASMRHPVRLQEIFIKRRLIVNRYSMSPAYELSSYKDANVCSTRARRG